jgi:predicted flap endonuclease-1-like 5' DNA nuclease
MSLDFSSVGIGLLLGLAIGLFIKRRRIEVAARVEIRDVKTRLTSVIVRLERTQNELAATKGVVARLLDDRNKIRANWEGAGADSELMVVLNDAATTHQLSQVRGIGPKLAVTLASYGINDLERLADITERDLSVIEASAPLLAERMVRERWKEQALELLQGPNLTQEFYSQLQDGDTVPSADEYSWARFRSPNQGRAVNGSN